MITGDHIVTASAIARELGILHDGERAITSQELDELSDEYLREHISEFSVFARVAPKDKVRIVETRKLSKDKNWRVAEIIEKAK